MTPHVISTIVLAAHWLLVVGLSLRVITRRSPVGVSVAWIAVMFAVPFVGAVLYLLFGERRLGRRRAVRTAARLAAVREWQGTLVAGERPPFSPVEGAAANLSGLARRLLGFPVLTANTLELFDDAQTIFDALIEDIERARETCCLSFYVWHERGRVGDVVDALLGAAGRGVRCRALADAVGSKRFLAGRHANRLRQGGVELRAALPAGVLPSLFSRADLRNHRKIAVIDGSIAYTGSQNLEDPRFFMQGAGVGEWVDAMVRITGSAATALDGVFELDWAVEADSPFRPPVASPEPAAGSAVQVVPSGPDLEPAAVQQLLLTAIYAARRELVITTPYFVPDDAILTALLSAALRGVEVTLIVPERNNSLLVRFASVAHFDDLLAAGVHIHLFKGGLLHTKSLVIDGETSVFGSVNLDMRSVWLNSEISLLVYDREFSARLRSLQSAYLADSDLLELSAWRRRPQWRKRSEDALRLLGPLL